MTIEMGCLVVSVLCSIVTIALSWLTIRSSREAEKAGDRAQEYTARSLERAQLALELAEKAYLPRKPTPPKPAHPWSEADREFFRQEAIRNADNPNYFAPQPPSMGRNWLAEEYRKNPW